MRRSKGNISSASEISISPVSCSTFDRTFFACICLKSTSYEIDAGKSTQEVRELGQWIPALRQQVGHVVVGQKYLVDRLVLGLLANGHLLLEGVPDWPRR